MCIMFLAKNVTDYRLISHWKDGWGRIKILSHDHYTTTTMVDLPLRECCCGDLRLCYCIYCGRFIERGKPFYSKSGTCYTNEPLPYCYHCAQLIYRMSEYLSGMMKFSRPLSKLDYIDNERYDAELQFIRGDICTKRNLCNAIFPRDISGIIKKILTEQIFSENKCVSNDFLGAV